jgi:hypothetical protein
MSSKLKFRTIRRVYIKIGRIGQFFLVFVRIRAANSSTAREPGLDLKKHEKSID